MGPHPSPGWVVVRDTSRSPPPLLLLSLNPPKRTPPQVRKTTGDSHSTAVEMELGSHRLRLPIRTLAFLYKKEEPCVGKAGMWEKRPVGHVEKKNVKAPCGGSHVLSYLTACDPMDCSPPGSSVQGILQARMLEWVAMPSSRGSSQPRDQIHVSCLAGGFFTIAPAAWKAHTFLMNLSSTY